MLSKTPKQDLVISIVAKHTEELLLYVIVF